MTIRTNGRAHPPVLPPADAAASPVISVRLDRVRPGGLNPRKHFDEAGLAELAASIKSVGLLEPVILRPAPGFKLVPGRESGKPGFFWENRGDQVLFGFCKTREEAELSPPLELVAGERRYRAAKLAGLTHIDAQVRELSDRQVLEVAVVENEQRSDTRPLEKAYGYGRLIDEHGYTVETLAAKVGKGETTIRGLLRLRSLPSEAQDALDAGTLSPSAAEVIARLPPHLRPAATAYALKPDQIWDDGKRVERLPSFRQVKDWVARHVLTELKGCCFRQDDATLLPEVGSCKLCPKRVGNLAREDPEAWQGTRADVCTDTACYRAKVAAHGERLKAQAAADGIKVLPPKESEKLFPYDGSLAYNAPYLDLAAQEYADPKKRSYKQLVGEELKDDMVIAFDQRGEAHRLVPKDKAAPVLREKLPAGRTSLSSYGRHDKEREAKARDRREAAKAANGTVADAMQAAAGQVAEWPGELVLRLRELAKALPAIFWTDCCRSVAVRRGLPAGNVSKESVRAEADNLGTAPQLLALIAELVASKLSYEWGGLYHSGLLSGENKEFWRAWGVDPAKLAKQAGKDRKAKARGKGRLKVHEPAAAGGEEGDDAAEG